MERESLRGFAFFKYSNLHHIAGATTRNSPCGGRLQQMFQISCSRNQSRLFANDFSVLAIAVSVVHTSTIRFQHFALFLILQLRKQSVFCCSLGFFRRFSTFYLLLLSIGKYYFALASRFSFNINNFSSFREKQYHRSKKKNAKSTSRYEQRNRKNK